MLTPIERCGELNPPVAGHTSDTSARHFWHRVRCCWSVAGAQHHRMTKPMTKTQMKAVLVALVVVSLALKCLCQPIHLPTC